MSNTDFDPQQQAPPPQPYFPPPPASPLTQLIQQQQRPPIPQLPSMQIASAETPGVNFTGGRQDVQPRDARTDLPAPAAAPTPPPTPAPPPQRYTPTAPRGHQNWGEIPDAAKAHENYPAISSSALMPTDDEAIRILQMTGKRLSQFSAPSVAGPANIFSSLAALIGPTMDFYSQGTFSSHYRDRYLGGLEQRKQAMAERREQMEVYRDQMIDSAQQAMVAHKQMMGDYGAVFKQHELGALTDAQAEQAIRNLNAKYQHSGLDSMINNRGIGAVQRWLDWEDTQFADTINGLTVLDQTKTRSGKTPAEENELDKAISAGGSTGGGTSTSTRTQLEPLKGEAAPAAPSSGDQAVENPDAAGMDADLMKKYNMSPTGMGMAHSLLQSADPADENKLRLEAKKNFGRPIGAARDMRTAINNIAANPALTPEQKLEEIGNIDKQVADKLSGIKGYDLDPKDKANQRWSALAHQVDPSFQEGKYKAVNDYFGPNTANAGKIQRLDAFPKSGLSLLKAIKPLSETESVPMRIIDQGASFYVTGDPKYSTVYQAIQGYINEYSGLLTANGVPRVTQIKMFADHFKSSMSPAQIRGAMQVDAQNASAMYDSVLQRWKDVSGRTTPPPGLQPRSVELLNGLLDMKPQTGQVTEDAPDELKAVGKKPPPKDKRPSWMTDRDAAPPLTRQQKEDARRWLQENPGAPGWDEINEELGINR
jgi:hypothetical protein